MITILISCSSDEEEDVVAASLQKKIWCGRNEGKKEEGRDKEGK